jgi:hypothetical protein
LNHNLNWSGHVDHLCKRISSGIFALGRLRDDSSRSSLKIVYYAHIYSHIRNSNIFWGHSSTANRIFVLQKRALRVIGSILCTAAPILFSKIFSF